MRLSRQLFLRFYLAIVISVVCIGWGIDFYWQSETESNIDSVSISTELPAIAAALDGVPLEAVPTAIKSINKRLIRNYQLIERTNISFADVESTFTNGEIVTVQKTTNQVSHYIQLDKHNLFLTIDEKLPHGSIFSLKSILIFIFYFLLALLIYWLTRPLSKDLSKLESEARSFTTSNWENQVSIVSTSPIYPLAKAYNDLLAKIKKLLSDQKEMSHAISHELRTPLARIRFSLEMASKSDKLAVKNQQIKNITEDVIEIQALVDELLNYASFENSATQVTFERGDLGSLLSSQLEKQRQLFPTKNFSLNLNSTTEKIYCDSFLIERAIQNLLVNAGKYAKDKVEITFSIDSNFVNIFIDDDGVGIAESERENIFESFVQLKANNRKSKGFGLGLAIVRKIMQLHRGKVYAKRSPLGGARFILKWPKFQVSKDD